MSDEADERLRRMIGSLRGERKPDPTPAPVKSGADAASEDYRRRIQELESRLDSEKERHTLQEQQRETVEAQIRQITDLLREEKRRAEIEKDKAHAQGRVESLEKRLDDLQEKLLDLIQKSIDARGVETEATRAAADRVDARIEGLEEKVQGILAETLSKAMPEFQKTLGDAVHQRLDQNNRELLEAYQKALDEALVAMRAMMLKTLDALLEAEKGRDVAAESRSLRIEKRMSSLEKEWKDFFNREPGL
ncbi:MAG: hypothetical protein COB53_06455 [Elusimicrobia bacterium]|nr:MAG: hypothetical protein COB53_06455 [Elusimicrobiota bacterium]